MSHISRGEAKVSAETFLSRRLAGVRPAEDKDREDARHEDAGGVHGGL